MTDPPTHTYPPRDQSSLQLTVRAVATGMVLGAVLSLCNIYVSLQIGWSTNMSVAGALLGLAVWRILGAVLRSMRPFGILESNINQTACSAAAAVSSAGLVAPIPALTLMTGRELPWAHLALWVFSVCLVGIAAAIAIRRQMIEVDRLPFPGGLATAETLKEMYGQGADAARRVLMLVAGAVVAGCVKVAAITKLLPSLPFQGRVAGHKLSALGFELDPSLLMVGVGALIGTRGAWSMMLGAVLAWGVVAPMALNGGLIELKASEPLSSLPSSVALTASDRLQYRENRQLLELRGELGVGERDRYLAMSDDLAWRAAVEKLALESVPEHAERADLRWTTVLQLPADHGVTLPSALADRFEIVGPYLRVAGAATASDADALRGHNAGAKLASGVDAVFASLPTATRLQPVTANFTDILEWLLWPGVTLMVISSLVSFSFSWRSIVRAFRSSGGPASNDSGDMPLRWFAAFATMALILSVTAQIVLFDIAWWAAGLGVILSIVLAIVAARVSGETNITPIGAMGKVTQLAFGALQPGSPAANLMTANVTGGAASQAADLLHDMKTGAILGATPWKQAIAQILGAVAGSLAGSAIYLVLIPNPHAQLLTPEWPAPAVATWKAVAELFQRGFSALPAGAPQAMLIAAIAGVVLPILDKLAPARLKPFVPSASSLGLSFVVAAKNAISIFIGAMLALAVGKFCKNWAAKFLVIVASGFVVGDALVGAGDAVLRVIEGLARR